MGSRRPIFRSLSDLEQTSAQVSCISGKCPNLEVLVLWGESLSNPLAETVPFCTHHQLLIGPESSGQRKTECNSLGKLMLQVPVPANIG